MRPERDECGEGVEPCGVGVGVGALVSGVFTSYKLSVFARKTETTTALNRELAPITNFLQFSPLADGFIRSLDKMVYTMNIGAIHSEWVGREIDQRFALLQWIGGSEQGTVFLTELRGPGSQKAAIKLIPADAVGAEDHAAVWATTPALSHPHLMHLLHTGRCQIETVPLFYAVTEFAEETLSRILVERSLTPAEVKDMLGSILDALSYLHGQGLVHGHLKPSNIMAVDDQFRISSDSLHIAGAFGRHNRAPRVYDAPEGATEAPSVAADVWSLGVTLVEALTQHPPVSDISEGEPIVPEGIPQPFADIARECLRSNPQNRCTIGDIKARLNPPRSVPNPDPPGEMSGKAPFKLRRTVLIAAALIVIAVVAGLQMRSHRTAPSSQAGEQGPTITAPENPTPTPNPTPATTETDTSTPTETTPPAPTQTPLNPDSTGVTVKGAVGEKVLPDVPQKATDTIHGKFELSIRVTVGSDGIVSNAALASPGPSRYFANLSLQAARNWKFKPAQVNGQAVPSSWLLRFQFSQTATEVTSVEESP